MGAAAQGRLQVGSEAWAPALAELVGTFALVFIGGGSVVANAFTRGALGLPGIALAHGLVLAIVISATGHISGGHINPAVTFGFLLTRRISPLMALIYVVAQLVGGILAGLALNFAFRGLVAEAAKMATPVLAEGVGVWQGSFLEMLLTFFLVFAVFGTAVHPRAPAIGGFGIGLVLTFDILMGGSLTGASMNPARTLGPAVAAMHWDDHWVYWLGPLVGGGLAALLYHYLLMGREREAGGVAPPRPS